MGFSRQEHCCRLPFPPTGDLPDPGIQPTFPALAGQFFTTEPPRKPQQEPFVVTEWAPTKIDLHVKFEDSRHAPGGYENGLLFIECNFLGRGEQASQVGPKMA